MLAIWIHLALLFALVIHVVAQLDTSQIPSACLSSCHSLLDLANTCIVEYPATSEAQTTAACFCNGLSHLDYSGCKTCLNSSAAPLGQSVSQLAGFCSSFVKECKYECGFTTCASTDISCQCSEPYLQKIYNCASCNTAHGNTDTTTIADYTALRDSCKNQGHSETPTAVEPTPTPSGIVPYTGGPVSFATATTPLNPEPPSSTHGSSGTSLHASAGGNSLTRTLTGGTSATTQQTGAGATPGSTGDAFGTSDGHSYRLSILIYLSILLVQSPEYSERRRVTISAVVQLWPDLAAGCRRDLNPPLLFTMATLDTLPTEIVLEIAEYVYTTEPRRLPIIGISAPWRMPPTIYPPNDPLPTVYPLPDRRKGKVKKLLRILKTPFVKKKTLSRPAPVLSVRDTSYLASLKALRCTSRFFARVCYPLLYRELDLRQNAFYYRWEAFSSGSRLLNWDYAQYAAMNLTIDCNISRFRNLKRLALYYRSGSIPSPAMQAATIKLLEVGNLQYLGIYSDLLIEYLSDRSWEFTAGIAEFIDAICLSPEACKNLRAFDVVVDCITNDTFDLIRSKLTSLESLTIRRTLELPAINYRLWDPAQQAKWNIYPNLTRLNLSHFDAGHAPHIPPLVRHFTALQELIVSGCGGYFDRGELRSSGWSLNPDALCNIRPALNLLWIEHMLDWEIYDLGAIPTKTLIVTTVEKQHLLVNLRSDAEIFPRLEVLRLAPPNQDRGDAQPPLQEDAVAFGNEPENDGVASVKDICDAREVTIRRDAMANWTCNCCSREIDGWY